MKAVIVFLLILSLLHTGIFAHEDVEEYFTDDMREALPEDILDDGVLSYDSLAKRIGKLFSSALDSVIKNALGLISVAVLSSLFSLFSASVKSEGMRKCFSYLSSAVVAIIVYQILGNVWTELEAVMGKMNSFMTTLTPVTTMLYALGGNVTTAAVNDSAMGIILTVTENICYHGIRPILRICFGFCILSALSGTVNVAPLSAFVRKIYTTVLVFVISTMTGILTLQNMLTRGADSIAMRTVRFATVSAIPLVGPSISEAAATVGRGIKAIRGSFGVLAIIAIALIILPTVLNIWLNRVAFSFGATICSVMGLNKECELINGGAQLLNFALAILSVCAVMFIITISLFAAAASVGG